MIENTFQEELVDMDDVFSGLEGLHVFESKKTQLSHYSPYDYRSDHPEGEEDNIRIPDLAVIGRR